jgi:hypothetical protein
VPPHRLFPEKPQVNRRIEYLDPTRRIRPVDANDLEHASEQTVEEGQGHNGSFTEGVLAGQTRSEGFWTLQGVDHPQDLEHAFEDRSPPLASSSPFRERGCQPSSYESTKNNHSSTIRPASTHGFPFGTSKRNTELSNNREHSGTSAIWSYTLSWRRPVSESTRLKSSL